MPDLLIRHEPELDFEETAQLAAEGFGKPAGSFSAEKLRWLYDRAFSHGTTVLSAYAGDRKVGQVALVHQRVRVGGAPEQAIQLVDLFILKAFRSRAAIAGLYGEVERFCQANGVRFIVGVPNASGARVNIRYLTMTPFLRLDIRAGLGLPIGRRRGIVSADLERIGRDEAAALFARVLPISGNGVEWTP